MQPVIAASQTQYTTTVILWPSYRCTCVEQYHELRTRGLVGAEFYWPHFLAGGNWHIWIMQKMMELS